MFYALQRLRKTNWQLPALWFWFWWFWQSWYFFSPYEIEFIDWEYMSIPPNSETQHYFAPMLWVVIYSLAPLRRKNFLCLWELFATVVSLIIGVTYGAIAGYFGEKLIVWWCGLLIFCVAFYVFGYYADGGFFGRNIFDIRSVGGYIWLDMARIVRGQNSHSLRTKNLLNQLSPSACIHRQLFSTYYSKSFGNCGGLCHPNRTTGYSGGIIPQLLGLGVQEPYTSWGALVNEGAQDMEIALVVDISRIFSGCNLVLF